MDELKEIPQFLNIESRIDVKLIAIQYVLGLTGNVDSIKLISQCEEVLKKVLLLTSDKDPVQKDALLTLVNITAEDFGSEALLNIKHTRFNSGKNMVEKFTEDIIDENNKNADAACMILCNISRHENHLDFCIESITPYLDQILNVFTNTSFNKAGANLHYLGPLFSNLSANAEVCKWLCDDSADVVRASRIASFCQFNESLVRRGGAAGSLRNLCFNVDLHEKLLGPSIDILTYLLLPLAGGEEYSDEEMNSLPIALQYLPKEKQRETDPDIRKLLLESLNKLCIKREGRNYLRENGTYYILRELHKWEQDRKVLLSCENVVDILIKKEVEIDVEDISSVNVPEKYHDKFKKMDEDFINDV